MLSTVSFVPTKPTKQPLFGPRHFVVGTGDFFRTTTSLKGRVVAPSRKTQVKPQAIVSSPKMMIEEVSSPRGPQENTYFDSSCNLSEYASSITSGEEDTLSQVSEPSNNIEIIPEQRSPIESVTSLDSETTSLYCEGFQDPDLAVNYSEDLDFLAEKLLLCEEQHQNLVKQVQNLKDLLKDILCRCQPDFIEEAIKSQGKNKKVSKQTITLTFGLEGELKSFESKMLALSRDVLAAQTQVQMTNTEVSSFSSAVAFKSERINALGLLNYGSVAKRMVSEINDAQIYCDLLAIWAADLQKFNHNLCYEISNLESSCAEYQLKLCRLKTALCSATPSFK